MKATEREGEQKRKIESRDDTKCERYGNSQEHRMFSNKENNSFIKKQLLCLSYNFPFYRVRRRRLR